MHTGKAAIAALTFIALLPAVSARAQFIPFIGQGERLEDGDMAALRQAIRGVLDSGTEGQTGSWSNPETGRHGDATLTDTYRRGETDCGTVDFTVAKAEQAAQFRFDFCRLGDGRWGIAG